MGMNEAALPVRAVLGNCEVRSVLGQGGGGISYLAYDLQLEREVVVKEHFPHSLCMRIPGEAEVQPLDAASYERSLGNFCREARILAGLNHPGVVKVHDIFQASGTAYMVMEYVEGESLSEWMSAHAQEPALVESLLVSLLDALAYIHGSEVLHRDVKPANIIVREDNSPVLIDFGAALLGDPQSTLTLVGSPGYAPPEQFQPHGSVGPWSDLYALAHSFIALISAEHLKNYRHAFVQALLKAGSPTISERYADAAAWKKRLLPRGHRLGWVWLLVWAGGVAIGLIGMTLLPKQAPGSAMNAADETPPPSVATAATATKPSSQENTNDAVLTRQAQKRYAEYIGQLEKLYEKALAGEMTREEMEQRAQRLRNDYIRYLESLTARARDSK